MRVFLFLTLFCLTYCRNIRSDSKTPIYELDNSSLIITDDDNQFYLSRCQVFKSQDTISINFSDTVKHSNWYELQILKIKNIFSSNLISTFYVTDSSFNEPIFKTYHQIITLDKSDYEIGDSIIGNVDLDISSYQHWRDIFTDTFKIKGNFRAIVQ